MKAFNQALKVAPVACTRLLIAYVSGFSLNNCFMVFEMSTGRFYTRGRGGGVTPGVPLVRNVPPKKISGTLLLLDNFLQKSALFGLQPTFTVEI